MAEPTITPSARLPTIAACSGVDDAEADAHGLGGHQPQGPDLRGELGRQLPPLAGDPVSDTR